MKINFFGIDITINKSFVFIFAILLALTLGLAGYQATIKNEGIVVETVKEREKTTTGKNEGNESTPAPSPAQTFPEQIMVYVVGCVNKPGIVKLDKGALIDDAIKAAGGATEEADLENINLVFKLEENVMLKILPKKADEKSKSAYSDSPENAGSGVAIVKEAGAAVEISSNQQGSTSGKKININIATVEQLETLPYIGVETAKDIISYREKNGAFKTIEEIMKVAGIKESRFSRIKDLITVE